MLGTTSAQLQTKNTQTHRETVCIAKISGMSELASNNPFRDRTDPPPYQVAVQPPSTSRNPFLDGQATSHGSRSVNSRSMSDTRDRHTGVALGAPRGTDYLNVDSARPSTRGREDRMRSLSHDQEHAARRSRQHNEKSGSSRLPREKQSQPESSSGKSTSKVESETRKSRSSKEKSSSGTSKPRKHLDKIDRLDVTGFSTTGGFHHDGPFDACNPNRNKNAKKAPVLAFAKDSTAMTMAAGPPSQPVYFGDHLNNTESFADYGNVAHKTRPTIGVRTASFDPSSNVDPIHGYESVGLGTTTFLEGAPASRSAMLARTVSDNGSRNELRPRATSDYASNSGLGRKKSVLQKIRGAYRERANEANQEQNSSPLTSPYKLNGEGQEYFEDSKGSNHDRAMRLPEKLPGNSSDGRAEALNRVSSGNNDEGSSSAATGLIKRVKSLRVSSKKRSEGP